MDSSTLITILAFIIGFGIGAAADFFYAVKIMKRKQPILGDLDGDGEGFTDKDLSVFQSNRNRKRAGRPRKPKSE
jgi:hypothetical protein